MTKKQEKSAILLVALFAALMEGGAMAAMKVLAPVSQYPGGEVLFTAGVACIVGSLLYFTGSFFLSKNRKNPGAIGDVMSLNPLPLILFGALDLGGIWNCQFLLERYLSSSNLASCFILGFLSGWIPAFLLINIYNYLNKTLVPRCINCPKIGSFLQLSLRDLKGKKKCISKMHLRLSVYLGMYEGGFFVWHFFAARPMREIFFQHGLGDPNHSTYSLYVFLLALTWAAGGAVSAGITGTMYLVFKKRLSKT